MTGWSLDNPLLLLAGIAGIWFTMRFIVGPKRGAPGLRVLFGREAPVQLKGMGREAIATVLEDTRQFVVASADLRGLVLAGPFAVRSATPTSAVVLVIFCDDISGYADKGWLDRWAYPARGHLITGHDTEQTPSGSTHRIRLRGAPQVELHFVRMDGIDPPKALAPALAKGSATIEDPSGLVEKLRLHWAAQLHKTSAASE
ncbi:MAG: hypothetical protein FD175_500 [Beijerinckiaceae bacterium]|nr:MAG: hypothetical protein FD175_500 [Beijerinckiaceae bacterium]